MFLSQTIFVNQLTVITRSGCISVSIINHPHLLSKCWVLGGEANNGIAANAHTLILIAALTLDGFKTTGTKYLMR